MLTLTSIFTALDSAVLMLNKEKIKGAKRKQKKKRSQGKERFDPPFHRLFLTDYLLPGPEMDLMVIMQRNLTLQKAPWLPSLS